MGPISNAVSVSRGTSPNVVVTCFFSELRGGRPTIVRFQSNFRLRRRLLCTDLAVFLQDRCCPHQFERGPLHVVFASASGVPCCKGPASSYQRLRCVVCLRELSLHHKRGPTLATSCVLIWL